MSHPASDLSFSGYGSAVVLGKRLTTKRIGASRFPKRRFRLWRRGRLKGPAGADCGPYYITTHCTIGPTLNGQLGFSVVNGQPRYDPLALWGHAGFQAGDLPDDFEEVNRKAEAKRDEMLRQRRDQTNIGKLEKMLAEQNRSIDSLVKGIGEAVHGAPNLDALAGPPKKRGGSS